MGENIIYHKYVPCWQKVLAIAAIIGIIAVNNKKEEEPYKRDQIYCCSQEDYAKTEQDTGCLRFTDDLEKRLEKLNCLQRVDIVSKHHEGITKGKVTYNLFCDGYDLITFNRYFEELDELDFTSIQALSKEEASRKVLRQIELEDYVLSNDADQKIAGYEDPLHFAIRKIQEKSAKSGYSAFPVSIKQLNSLELSDNLQRTVKYIIKDGAVTIGKDIMQFTKSVDRLRFAMKEFKIDDFGCVTNLKYRVYEHDLKKNSSRVVYEYKPKKMGYCEKLHEF